MVDITVTLAMVHNTNCLLVHNTNQQTKIHCLLEIVFIELWVKYYLNEQNLVKFNNSKLF